MKLKVGLHLDGQRGWHAENSFDSDITGPLGLLGLLEARLGLQTDPAPGAHRVAQYREFLKTCDRPDRFYHASFSADELGSARTLLNWRDEWMMAGWNGHVPDSPSPRIRDLAEVESANKGNLKDGTAERLKAILEALDCRSSGIEAVELADSLVDFPVLWQLVLQKLNAVEPAPLAPGSSGTSTLARLQAALKTLLSGGRPESIPWLDDGSIRIFRSPSTLDAANWLAKSLALDNKSVLLVVTDKAAVLDTTLVQNGLPAQGLSEKSAFRPALQLLPLVLSLGWKPLNFTNLLEFLMHPLCPIRPYARARLARKVADQPGIGGEGWEEALKDIRTHYGETSDDVIQTIREWLECERFDMEKGAAIGQLFEKANAILKLFKEKTAHEPDEAERKPLYAGQKQCEAVIASLSTLMAQGVGHLRPRQVEQVLTQATARGSGNPLWFAQAGSLHEIDHPGAAIASFRRVVWWRLTPGVAARLSLPWSDEEIVALESCGALFPRPDAVQHQEVMCWLRPLLSARDQLDLILPAEGEETHPVWQLLESLLHKPIIFKAQEMLQPALHFEHATTPPQRPLPAAKRWWILPEGAQIKIPEEHSFSSLNLLINDPYEWVLRYPAQLSVSRLLSVSDGPQLYGKLSHRMLELFYIRQEALQADEASLLAWVEQNFPVLLEQEGATLLMPGRVSDREELAFRLTRAMKALRLHLAEAGIRKVNTEQELKGSFSAGKLKGYADLVLERGDGAIALVDAKWGSGAYYGKKISQGQPVQLALYGELIRQSYQRHPAIAYFILRDASMLAPDRNYFPNARTSTATGNSTAQIWISAEASIRWRLQQIRNRTIEVVQEDIEPTDASTPPEGALEIEPQNPAYNDFIHLAGWRAEA